MQMKAENPIERLRGRPVPAALAAYFELCHLKQLYRRGWLRRGVPPERCESVAEHSFGVAVLTLWLAQSAETPLDADKALRMALLHDLGEIYAGDIIPADGIEGEVKHRLEEDALHRVADKLPGGEAIIDLWREYEAGETAEARFVRQIDRLEMGLQATVYRSQGMAGMEEFFESARRALTDPQLIGLLDALIEEHSKDEAG